MIFHATAIPGAFEIELNPIRDTRGSFSRTFCAREFAAHGLDPRCVQSNLSVNARRGTLRGLHSQRSPFSEGKLIHCIRGSIWDVLLDLRPESPAYQRHQAFELRPSRPTLLYAPAGVYHGFLTLEDDSEVLYQMSEYHHPEAATGVRWNDPAFGIPWPVEVAVISDRDASYPDWHPAAAAH